MLDADAPNDEFIVMNPLDQIALVKLIRQKSNSSNYVIEPFTQAEREIILNAFREENRPMFQF